MKEKTYPYLQALVLFTAYFITARLGLKLDAVSGFATLVWPPSGIAIACLLLFGGKLWPAVFLSAFLVNYSVGASIPVALGISVGNTLEAVLAVVILRKVSFRTSLERLTDVAALVVFAAFIATSVSATIGTTTLLFAKNLTLNTYASTWVAWWFGDVMGALVITPFLLVWSSKPSLKRITPLKLFETVGLIFLIILTSVFVFTDLFFESTETGFPNPYLVFPVLMILALRLKMRGIVTALLCVSIVTIASIVLGHGRPWVGGLTDSLLHAQIYLAVVTISKMVLAAAVTELKQEREALIQSNARRQAAEAGKKRSEEEQLFLAEATAILSESIDFKTTLKRIAELSVPRIADWCIVHIMGEDGKFHSYELTTATNDKNHLLDELVTKYLSDIDGPTTIASVIKSKKTKLIETGSDQVYRAISKDARHYELLKELQFKALIVCPLIFQGKVLGALSIVSAREDRKYGPSDIVLVEELSKRAAIAIENARLYHEAQDAIRVRDEFLSIASHELKTPLTALSLQLQVFTRSLQKSLEARGTKLGSDPTSMVEVPLRAIEVALRTEKQGDKLKVLLDELLDLTRIRLGKLELYKERVDLAAMAKEAVDRFKAETASKGIPISFSSAGQPVGLWDPVRIEQVVNNLISNAVKYGEEKPVSVSVEDDPKLSVARLVVRDKGMGISPEMRGKIFERFERADVESQKIPGLGLGLYICRQIVQAHGGSISVVSEIGNGSTFTVEIPLTHPVS